MLEVIIQILGYKKKAKTSSGATAIVGVDVYDTLGALLPLMGAAPVRLSLPPKGKF